MRATRASHDARLRVERMRNKFTTRGLARELISGLSVRQRAVQYALQCVDLPKMDAPQLTAVLDAAQALVPVTRRERGIVARACLRAQKDMFDMRKITFDHRLSRGAERL